MIHKKETPNKTRKRWGIFLAVAVLILLSSGCGGSKPKVYRIGILCGLDFFANITDGFKEQMTKLGYKEGENVIYDVQKINLDPDAFKRILHQFVADKVDLVLVFPTEPAIEAKAALQGTNIPMLFANVGIETTNLINSVREPGGNITGVRYPAPELCVKRLDVLLELAPHAKRICIPYQDVPHIKALLKSIYEAKDPRITVVEAPLNNVAELDAFFTAREKSGHIDFDAILLITEPLVRTTEGFTIAAKFAYKHKLPLGGSTITVGEYSSIFGLTPDNVDAGRQAAPMADKIFKGVAAGTIPVRSPEYSLQINLKAAKQLGVTVPDNLLLQAKEIAR